MDDERIRVPRRSLGLRSFQNGLSIRTSTSLLCEDTGGDVWRGAIALAKYLEEDLHDAVFGKRILELGAGTGLLGLSLALAGAHEVCITDKENTVPLVQQNIDENAELLASRGACARAEVLNWFAPALGEGVLAAGPYDLVVVSDVFYEEEIVEPFVSTLRRVILRCSAGDERRCSDPCEDIALGPTYPGIVLCASHRTERIEDLFHSSGPLNPAPPAVLFDACARKAHASRQARTWHAPFVGTWHLSSLRSPGSRVAGEWFEVAEVTEECSFARMLRRDLISIFRISVRPGVSAEALATGLSDSLGEPASCYQNMESSRENVGDSASGGMPALPERQQDAAILETHGTRVESPCAANSPDLQGGDDAVRRDGEGAGLASDLDELD